MRRLDAVRIGMQPFSQQDWWTEGSLECLKARLREGRGRMPWRERVEKTKGEEEERRCGLGVGYETWAAVRGDGRLPARRRGLGWRWRSLRAKGRVGSYPQCTSYPLKCISPRGNH